MILYINKMPKGETEGYNNVDDSEFNYEFCKVLREFIPDFLNTFPEYKTKLHPGIHHIMDQKYVNAEKCVIVTDDMREVYNHSMKHIPSHFFDILYQNVEMFIETNSREVETETNTDTGMETHISLSTEFIIGIDFSQLWTEEIGEKTKEILWKYLQLLLFALVTDMKEKTEFGETAKLFEAIHKDEFKSKLEETMKNIHSYFETSGNEFNIPKDDMPDPEKIHEHIDGMMKGKIGLLAKEIAEETIGDLDLDGLEEELSSENGSNKDATSFIFQKLFKNPSKLMNITKKIGSTLDNKIKSGELKESELMEEATELMKKMKEMPGMGNMSELFKSMSGGLGGKMNFGAMNNHLQKDLQKAKMRERLQEKLKAKEDQRDKESSEIKLIGEGKNQIYSTTDVPDKTPRPVNKKKNKKKKKKKKLIE